MIYHLNLPRGGAIIKVQSYTLGKGYNSHTLCPVLTSFGVSIPLKRLYIQSTFKNLP
uniref:Uncharacterized protein n=1 Tax=Anguilla anguilla TaxID=7936 RepID=A0A0E9P9C2_ANGAN